QARSASPISRTSRSGRTIFHGRLTWLPSWRGISPAPQRSLSRPSARASRPTGFPLTVGEDRGFTVGRQQLFDEAVCIASEERLLFISREEVSMLTDAVDCLRIGHVGLEPGPVGCPEELLDSHTLLQALEA